MLAVFFCFSATVLGMLSLAAQPIQERRFGENTALRSDIRPLAPTSGPGWSKVTAGDLSKGTLSAVACTSASQCWAVGSYDTFSGSQTLIEQWNGTSWSIVASPSTGLGSKLSGVTCSSASQCWAVGSYPTTGGIDQTLIEQWNGSSWSIVSSPNVGSSGSVLRAATCSSATQCWAVGQYQGGSGGVISSSFIEEWNGTSWSVVASPVGGFKTADYTGVACSSATQCWAVGFVTGIDQFGEPFSERTIDRWDGTSWTSSAAFQNGYFSSVACASATQCWAVGVNGANTSVAEWNGTSWVPVSAPGPGSFSNALNSVTCVSTSVCWAVGASSNAAGENDQTLFERWNGVSWSVVSSPNSAPAEFNDLNGVTCVPGSLCFAVGYHSNANSGSNQTLVEQLSFLGTWSIIPSANYIPTSVLNGVTCASVSQCWTVGYDNEGTSANPVNQILFEQWNGTAWTIFPRPILVGASSLLQGVTCTSASQCWSVGAYLTGNHYQTLIYQWAGTSWSFINSPNTSTTQSNLLSSVACASTSQCFTVGNYLDSALNVHTLMEQWNGSAWSIVPPPAGLGAASELNGVTCVSGQCWAVGYNLVSSSYQTLIEQWNGTSWSIIPSANTTNVNFLNAVTCNSNSDCWTVGYYQNSSFIYQTLVEHWDGSAWSIVSSPNVGMQNNYLTSTTCSSASDCWATGYNGASGSYQTLTEHWDGASWSIVSSVNPGSSHNNVLNGIACSSAALCWAVGDYNNGSIDQTLIEAYSPVVPAVTRISSMMTHGSAGTFGVDLPLIGTRGIECRNGNGNYSVVFTFVNDVSSCGMAGTTGGSMSPGPLTNQCTENLTGVPNQQYTTVALNNVLDAESNNGNPAVQMGVLLGDVNANGGVDGNDVSAVQSHTRQLLNATNFQYDVNVTGGVDGNDVSMTQSHTRTSLPSPP